MPFGFWVLGNFWRPAEPHEHKRGLKCLSAFGFWGTSSTFTKARFQPARSQMPFGFWVLGNCELVRIIADINISVSNAFRLLGSGELKPQSLLLAGHSHVSNAFRLLGSGEPHPKRGKRKGREKSQMPFGFWVLGNTASHNYQFNSLAGLKCLSAFGFWGTATTKTKNQNEKMKSQMPFGFWVLGNPNHQHSHENSSHPSLKCLSAFGFWGTWFPQSRYLTTAGLSQMPFGFWVLGNFSG